MIDGEIEKRLLGTSWTRSMTCTTSVTG